MLSPAKNRSLTSSARRLSWLSSSSDQIDHEHLELVTVTPELTFEIACIGANRLPGMCSLVSDRLVVASGYTIPIPHGSE